MERRRDIVRGRARSLWQCAHEPPTTIKVPRSPKRAQERQKPGPHSARAHVVTNLRTQNLRQGEVPNEFPLGAGWPYVMVEDNPRPFPTAVGPGKSGGDPQRGQETYKKNAR